MAIETVELKSRPVIAIHRYKKTRKVNRSKLVALDNDIKVILSQNEARRAIGADEAGHFTAR